MSFLSKIFKKKETVAKKEADVVKRKSPYSGNYEAIVLDSFRDLSDVMPQGALLFKADVEYLQPNKYCYALPEPAIGVFAIFAKDIDTVVDYFNEVADYYKGKDYRCFFDFIYDGCFCPLQQCTDLRVLSYASKIIAIRKRR